MREQTKVFSHISAIYINESNDIFIYDLLKFLKLQSYGLT